MLAGRTAEHEKSRADDTDRDDLPVHVAHPLFAAPIVADQRRAAGHHAGFRCAEREPADEDRGEAVEPRRRRADEPVHERREQQQHLASDAIGQPAGERRTQRDREGGARRDERDERGQPRVGRHEFGREFRQDWRDHHRAHHGETTAEQQHGALARAGLSGGTHAGRGLR